MTFQNASAGKPQRDLALENLVVNNTCVTRQLVSRDVKTEAVQFIPTTDRQTNNTLFVRASDSKFLFTGPGSGQTVIMDRPGPSIFMVGPTLYPFSSIQAAINAAVAAGHNFQNPTTVYVTSGIYNEDINLAGGINIVGVAMQSVIIIGRISATELGVPSGQRSIPNVILNVAGITIRGTLSITNVNTNVFIYVTNTFLIQTNAAIPAIQVNFGNSASDQKSLICQNTFVTPDDSVTNATLVRVSGGTIGFKESFLITNTAITQITTILALNGAALILLNCILNDVVVADNAVTVIVQGSLLLTQAQPQAPITLTTGALCLLNGVTVFQGPGQPPVNSDGTGIVLVGAAYVSPGSSNVPTGVAASICLAQIACT